MLNLEALLVKMQMAICKAPTEYMLENLTLVIFTVEELVPQKSRYLLRVSLGHFKDLQDSPPVGADTLRSVVRLGLPIFVSRLHA